jgi:NAD(P)-dependent dehydrogenase (short-subunit alcohol dehydrogenase family)
MKCANWGRIIFISSEDGGQIPVEMIHYGVTNRAQLAISRSLAEAVSRTGFTVTCVLSGPTKSRGGRGFRRDPCQGAREVVHRVRAELFAKVRPTSLIKRFASPDELASLVVYLASPLASATDGAAFRVDGGVVKSVFKD